MPNRPKYLKGNYYHLYNRGRSRLSIFHRPEDYLDALVRIRKYSQALEIAIIAYVLLPNHFHILVRQDGSNRASLLTQRTFNGYAKKYNAIYKHSGTIFEGDAKGILVNREDHLLHLCRYIHANPLRHGFAKSLNAWPYSNYQEWVGLRKGKWWDADFVIDFFESSEQYQVFLTDYLISKIEPEGFSEDFVLD